MEGAWRSFVEARRPRRRPSNSCRCGPSALVECCRRRRPCRADVWSGRRRRLVEGAASLWGFDESRRRFNDWIRRARSTTGFVDSTTDFVDSTNDFDDWLRRFYEWIRRVAPLIRRLSSSIPRVASPIQRTSFDDFLRRFDEMLRRTIRRQRLLVATKCGNVVARVVANNVARGGT